MKLIATLTAGFAVVSGAALAEECKGSSARVNAPPVAVHQAEDGTITTYLDSTDANTFLAPASMAGTGWQNCSGIIVTKADKSASGNGVCFHVLPNGDWQTVSWSLAGAERTWKRESGTGQLSGAASGTWEPGIPMGDGLSIGAWQGNCE